MSKLLHAEERTILEYLFRDAQPLLRAAWRDPATDVKESTLLMLAGDYMHQRGTQGLTMDGFLRVLLYALKHVHLLRYCANPDCKEPYFVGGRASQVFCSEPCAMPAQREAKKRWWDEHGQAARRKRTRRQRRGAHAKTKKA